jgi:chromosome segregation ATPase
MQIIPVETIDGKIDYMPILLEKDNQLMHLEEQIERKRHLLIQKQKKLKQMEKQNKFLGEIRNDYSKYYNFIVQQKKDQIKALEALDEYIKDLTRSNKLSKHNIEDSKHEQEKIMHEITYVKNSLDDLLNNINDLDKTLKDKKVI